MKRAVAIVTLAASALLLTGCDSREECEARGGTWRSYTVLMPTIIGKQTYLLPQTYWDCTK